MMDIKYDFKANPFKEKDGKPVLYPAVVVKETITTDHIVKELSKHSAYSAGCVVGVLQEVADRYGCIPFAARKKLWGIERSGFFNGREKWAKGFENQRV